MIWKTLGFQLAAVMAVVALIVFVAPWQGPAPGPFSHTRSSLQQEDTAGPLWSPGPENDPRENAEQHWQKHGGEFPELHSAADYIAAAHRFVSHPPPGALTKANSRGDTLIYDPQTNTFARRMARRAPCSGPTAAAPIGSGNSDGARETRVPRLWPEHAARTRRL